MKIQEVTNQSDIRAGVINLYSLEDWFTDEYLYNDKTIDLGYEEYLLELQREGKTEEEIEEALEYYESDNCYLLIGDWKKDKDGKYLVDKNGKNGWSATYSNSNGAIVCIEYSKKCTPCHHTSPCYVMADGRGPCGDLDTKGDSVIAYCFPEDYYRKED